MKKFWYFILTFILSFVSCAVVYFICSYITPTITKVVPGFSWLWQIIIFCIPIALLILIKCASKISGIILMILTIPVILPLMTAKRTYNLAYYIYNIFVACTAYYVIRGIWMIPVFYGAENLWAIYLTIIYLLFFITLIAYVIFHKKTERNRQGVNNPIETIGFYGTMGFELGDSYEFCKSRMEHLSIPVESDGYENELYEGFWDSCNMPCSVTCGKNTYNNIDQLSFGFKQRKLESIAIYVDYSRYGLDDMFDILKNKLCKRLQVAPVCDSSIVVAWYYNFVRIELSKIETKGKKILMIYIYLS